jgi:hypothetical protein
MPRFLIGTDDAVTARKMLALAEEAEAAAPAKAKPPAAAPALPVPHPGLPPAVPSGPPAVITAPTPVAAVIPPPGVVTPPMAPPITPAAPPPSALPPAAPAAAAEPDAEDSAVLGAGWTLEHVKSTAQAYVKKHGNAGPGQIAALCAKYIPSVPKPTVSKVPAKYWPALHADLSA